MEPISADPTDLVVLKAIHALRDSGQPEISSSQLSRYTGISLPTVKRALERLLAGRRLVRHGRARATRYQLPYATTPSPEATAPRRAQAPATSAAGWAEAAGGPVWSPAAQEIRRYLDTPLATREPVTYQRDFVDAYEPNRSALLRPELAAELAQLGSMRGQQPAGTYARKVLEQLLIDLSWSSSHLEGNRYSRLDTEELFRHGVGGGDSDAVMLLNHKNAIEFLVDAVPEQGLTLSVARNLHALLMQDLLADSASLGTIRHKVVNISGSVYLPTQVPSLLEDMLERIIGKAARVNNPVEAAFFLWINMAYLQPFEDGNKRTSRLCANIPLLLYNCAPLSFMDVDRDDHAQAMLGVYELRDVRVAAELFEWTYRRSCRRYGVILDAVGRPDPMRLRYRESLNDAIGRIVRDRLGLVDALASLGLDEARAPGFEGLLREELDKLQPYNCARYRLTMAATQGWIDAGRPR